LAASRRMHSGRATLGLPQFAINYEEGGENAIFHGVPPPSCFWRSWSAPADARHAQHENRVLLAI